jgi:hypothetical protein
MKTGHQIILGIFWFCKNHLDADFVYLINIYFWFFITEYNDIIIFVCTRNSIKFNFWRKQHTVNVPVVGHNFEKGVSIQSGPKNSRFFFGKILVKGQKIKYVFPIFRKILPPIFQHPMQHFTEIQKFILKC